jgi:hypothetical protein
VIASRILGKEILRKVSLDRTAKTRQLLKMAENTENG